MSPPQSSPLERLMLAARAVVDDQSMPCSDSAGDCHVESRFVDELRAALEAMPSAK
jgi:hypothetical protein